MCSCSKKKQAAAPASTTVVYADGSEKAFQSAITAQAVVNRNPGSRLKELVATS
jgi:hypothetical protein